MIWLKDIHNRQVRLSSERQEHIKETHPEMSGQIDNIQDALVNPDVIVSSRTDPNIELFYRHFIDTPVADKYLCVIVKISVGDLFIVTAYFTDTVKRGEVLWQKK